MRQALETKPHDARCANPVLRSEMEGARPHTIHEPRLANSDCTPLRVRRGNADRAPSLELSASDTERMWRGLRGLRIGQTGHHEQPAGDTLAPSAEEWCGSLERFQNSSSLSDRQEYLSHFHQK